MPLEEVRSVECRVETGHSARREGSVVDGQARGDLDDPYWGLEKTWTDGR